MATSIRRFFNHCMLSKSRRTLSSFHQKCRFQSQSCCRNYRQSSFFSVFYPSINHFSSSPHPIIDYFKLLDLPKQFDIDLDVLRNNFQQKMKEFHPDKHAQKSDSEKKDAEKTSIQLNTARTVLESPLFRAQHLLSLLYPNDANTLLDDSYQIKDQHFLFEIMDIRTSIESTENQKDLQQIMDKNTQTMNELISQIAAEFESLSDKSMENVTEMIAKLTYYHRIEGEVKEKLPSRE